MKSSNKYNNGPNSYQIFYTQKYDYDHARRGKSVQQQLWCGPFVAPWVELSAINYNYKDQVTEKNIGRRVGIPNAKALQSIDYQYNQRGWLTDINQQPLSYHNEVVRTQGGMQVIMTDPNPTFRIMDNEGSVDLFSETIRYNNPNSLLSNLATPQYNGNISQAVWQIAGREQQAYTYKYDNLDRLLEGEYTDIHDMEGYTPFSEQYSTDNKFGEKLTYDLRGNILSLQRNGMTAAGMSGGSYVSGTFGQIDNLAYTYNTKNQVTAITDAANATKGFKGTSSAYTYDANGNLKSDVAKGITNIVYNYLNLPQTIEFTNNRKIEFIYDATGMKLRKTTYENNVVKESREYMDGFEYVNDKIERIHHAEGVITQRAKRADEGTEFVGAGGLVWQYEYTLKDHLGNTRVTFADLNNSGTIDPNTEINQINHYYPFGLNMEGNWNGAAGANKYGYNGKELQTDFGLDWNHHQWRFYDPSVARWWVTDPMSEQKGQMSFSPYHFAYNNPISFADPLGLYGSKGKAERMRERAQKNGADVGEVYQSGKEWGFTTSDEKTGTITHHFKQKYFGSVGNKIGDFFRDINPVRSGEFYASGVIKISFNTAFNTTTVIPYGGGQAAYSSDKGGGVRVITAADAYVNIKANVPIKGLGYGLDVRTMPFNGAVKIQSNNPNSPYGDWVPSDRFLLTIFNRPVFIPLGDVPVPVGETKVQGDLILGGNGNIDVGVRGTFETIKILNTFSLEIAVGARSGLKIPEFFKD